jgi:hypothetical protein
MLFYKPLHLEAQQVSTRIEVRRHQLDQARSLIRRSTTPHPTARSHPRSAFGCRSKGDQPAPGYRLGAEGPKDGEIKENAEGGKAKSSSQTTRNQYVGN